ncbi:hypothetical protein C8Q76DRAFT_595436, partial [Earliella scabrosa]
IDERLAVLEGATAAIANVALPAERNTRSRINRIPTELLVRIFSVLAAQDDNEDLVNVPHVCRAWRNIAVDSPHLWTPISIIRPDKTDAFLARAK